MVKIQFSKLRPLPPAAGYPIRRRHAFDGKMLTIPSSQPLLPDSLAPHTPPYILLYTCASHMRLAARIFFFGGGALDDEAPPFADA